MPYPLPEGHGYTETLRWFLVAVPDMPEYVTAGLGAYTEFGNRYMWGKEGPTDESENAAQSWHVAIAATLEALEMGFPDILLGHIDDVETLLRAIRDVSCCTPGGTPISNTGGTLEIDPIGIEADEPTSELSDPTTWPPDYETDPTGATAFSDLAAISDYLCRAANAMFVLFLDFITVAGWFLDAKYALAAFLREAVQIAIARLFPTATGSFVAFAYDAIGSANDEDWEALDRATLEAAKTELEALQNDIVCAWANANSYTEAITDSAAIITSGLTSNLAAAWLIGGGLLGFTVGLLFRMWADPLDYTCTACIKGYTVTPVTGITLTSVVPSGTNVVLTELGDGYYTVTGRRYTSGEPRLKLGPGTLSTPNQNKWGARIEISEITVSENQSQQFKEGFQWVWGGSEDIEGTIDYGPTHGILAHSHATVSSDNTLPNFLSIGLFAAQADSSAAVALTTANWLMRPHIYVPQATGGVNYNYTIAFRVVELEPVT